MEINIEKKINGRNYICLTDFSKEYRKRYKKVYNLSQSLRNIPKRYIISGIGSKSKTYLDSSLLEFYLNSRRNIPKEFIDDFLKEVNFKISKSSYYSNMECLFLDTLIGFLSSMLRDLKFVKQYSLCQKLYDLCISDKILIEFDEKQHITDEKNIKNDLEKDKIANKNNFLIIRVNCESNFGVEISKIYKIVKKEIY